jgi:glyoxylase I family protein
MSLPEFGVEHIGLAATDPQALQEWYVRVFGARILFRNDETPSAFLLTMPGGSIIEIYPAHHPLAGKSNNRSSGLRHVALNVKSIEHGRKHLEARGVTISEEVKPAGGGGKVLFFQDPEGNLLHLVERTGST